MARNGSGTYSLPAGNPVVTGTIISSTVHNNTMSDIATELTNSVDKDGQTVITGAIDYNGNALILDADGDSKLEVSTDDRFDVTLGAVLSLSLTSAEALKLDAISDLAVTDGNIIVGNGTTWVAESGSTARQSLGVDLTTKGSILAGDGSAPAALSVGANGTILQANSSTATGLEWAAIPGTASDYQSFTASGTWTKPTAAKFVLVEIWSGGGGGAGSGTTNNAGGGSGGEYVYALFDADDLGATETVTIGAGGAGGTGANGSAGGNTTFGSFLTAVGGNPGQTGGNYSSIPRANVVASSSGGAGAVLQNIVFPQAGYGGSAGVGFGGGSTINGGGGGGGADDDASAGGTSARGGAGGAGATTGTATAGSAPAGGGGGCSGGGTGGAGARGEARIWTW